VDPTDSNRGPLPVDGLRRYFVAVESPKLTLATVVRGMLTNHGCQTDTSIRRRYSGKVFTVLQTIAKALLALHSQGYVHGNLTIQSCAKFDDKWKLTKMLDAKRFGEILPPFTETNAIPPEALQWNMPRGSDDQIGLKNDFVARPSIDVWAFGKLAYEALVGKPLFGGANDNNDEIDSLSDILQWNDASLVEMKLELRSIGVAEADIELISQCLSPHEGARPQIDNLLQHTCWSQC
jgi:serine/threonine protein kinase